MSKQWANLLFRTDFTDVKAALKPLPVGPLSTENRQLVAGLLNDHDMNEESFGRWDAEPHGTQYSLEGVEVVYNGANKRSFSTNSTFKNVLILKFPATSEAPQDRIYLQYN